LSTIIQPLNAHFYSHLKPWSNVRKTCFLQKFFIKKNRFFSTRVNALFNDDILWSALSFIRLKRWVPIPINMHILCTLCTLICIIIIIIVMNIYLINTHLDECVSAFKLYTYLYVPCTLLRINCPWIINAVYYCTY